MSTFAKLYDTKQFGQILVTVDETEDESVVTYQFKQKGFGVHRLNLIFPEAKHAVNYFNAVTAMVAYGVIKDAVAQMKDQIAVDADTGVIVH